MKIYRVLLSTYLSFFSLVLNAGTCDSLSSLEWILGHWMVDDDNTISNEIWKEASPLTFEGSGEVRAKVTKEIQSSETMRLVLMGGEIFYLAKVSHNQRPVAFRLTSCKYNRAIFENSDHDFPRSIDYQLETENSLIVIVGDGKEKGFKVNYTRDVNSEGERADN